jgi:protein ImuA
MSGLVKRAEIFSELQKEILVLQGFKSASNTALDLGLGPIRHAFPNSTFPVGAVHEFLSSSVETGAATSGFISGLLSNLMGKKGTTMWISSSRTLFPPALKNFGIQPDRFVFIDLKKEKDVLWAMDEALKCGALTAVVGELRDIDFTASRRLQLAVEESQVTGFVLRNNPKPPNTTACVSRWKITSLPSETVDGLPGIGFPHWKVELLRIRNGKPGSWDVMWKKGKFHSVDNEKETSLIHQHKKTG